MAGRLAAGGLVGHRLQRHDRGVEDGQAGDDQGDAHDAAVAVLAQGMLDVGLLDRNVYGTAQDVIAQRAYFQFYMHRTGHWLGMDVHDVGTYKVDGEWRTYEAGMVVTVEPGLYIAPDDETVDPKWRGIGIRIEDDIVATKNGPLNLTSKVVKTVEEIEALMAAAQ